MLFLSDIHADLFHQDRIIFLNDHIDRENSTDIVAQLRYLEARDPRADITLIINSPGGEVNSGFFILDTMRTIRPNVATLCGGIAGSMSAVLFSSGAKGKRGIYENAELMFHTVSSMVSGKERDIALSAEHTSQLNTRLLKIIAHNCGKSYEEISGDLEHDFYLTAVEAVEYGAADFIVK